MSDEVEQGNAWGRLAFRTGMPWGLPMALLFWHRDHGWTGFASPKFLVTVLFSLGVGYLFGGVFWSAWGLIGGRRPS